jgi:hypothetical protein
MKRETISSEEVDRWFLSDTKWKVERLTKDQRAALQEACLAALAQGTMQCWAVQSFANRTVESVSLPTATRVVCRKRATFKRLNQHFREVDQTTGFQESHVRSALNSLIRKGKVERTRTGSNETFYHLTERLTDEQKAQVTYRENKKKIFGALEAAVKQSGLGIDVYATETTSIQLIMTNDAAQWLLQVLVEEQK